MSVDSRPLPIPTSNEPRLHLQTFQKLVRRDLWRRCIVWSGFFAILVWSGCGPQIDVPNADAQDTGITWGKAAFALTSETASKTYALRAATFTVAGAETITLDSSETPDAATLVHELPSGAYTVELQPGYQLVEVTAEGDREVTHTLESPNPQSILIMADDVTPVAFIFRTTAAPVAFGAGSLAIAIQVQEADSPGLVISEFMVNPSAVADTAGEWVEVANTSEQAVSLERCRVLRDGSGFTVDKEVVVPAGGFVTLANGNSPGFTPAYVYSGLTLPNTSGFTLALECGGTIIDSVNVSPSGWPIAAGTSASLDPGFLSQTKNDAASAWCLATSSYGVDFGTPGSTNDSCPKR